MIWLLWRSPTVVGLKMDVDDLTGWSGVFIALMRVSRNQGGVPGEVLGVIEGFLIDELRMC